MKWLEKFKKPDAQYRGKPFWAWNGKLDTEELRQQVHVLKKMGLGGFFMHARVGLDTPYLSDEWFKCISACVNEAKKLGMEAWLYDEDRWPSGFAGGLVTKNKKYRQRVLMIQVFDDKEKLFSALQPKSDHDDTIKTIAIFIAKLDKGTAANVKYIKNLEQLPKLSPGQSYILFSESSTRKSSWYNEYTYLDTLSHDAVKAFIDTTHEEYSKRYKQLFGNVIPGIFTDEPNHASMGVTMPWDDGNNICTFPWTGRFWK